MKKNFYRYQWVAESLGDDAAFEMVWGASVPIAERLDGELQGVRLRKQEILPGSGNYTYTVEVMVLR